MLPQSISPFTGVTTYIPCNCSVLTCFYTFSDSDTDKLVATTLNWFVYIFCGSLIAIVTIK